MSKALRLPGTGRSRRPGLALAVLTAASVAVLAAAGVWLRTGWTGIGLVLRSQLCNGTPLEGFSLSGSLGWTRSRSRVHFTLQDGVLRTELRLDDPDAIPESTGAAPHSDAPVSESPADARQVLAEVSMADSSTLLLYLNDGGMLCADLVNAAGTRTDHRELTTLEETAHLSATLLPRTTDRDAALWVETYDLQDDGFRYSTALPVTVLLRAENGRFTVACALEDKDHLNPDTALLNEAGDKVLFAYENTLYREGVPTAAGENGRGMDIRVYDLEGGRLQYWGTMSTGVERDWYADYPGSEEPAVRQLYYDSLQKDGGNWK